MKRFVTLLLALALLSSMCLFVGCGEKKILHCDNCGEEVEVDADSNMEEDWSIYCGPCNEELFGNDPVLNGYETPFDLQ